MSNPFGSFDVDAYDGKDIAPNVSIIGSIFWDNKLQKWCALANFYGSLAIVELRVTITSTENKS
jgi:hypothetical protein